MDIIGAFEAKTHLSELLERVEQGEAFTITRHGKPVAKLVPVDQDRREVRHAAVDRLKNFAKDHNLTLGGIDWRELRDEGRK